MFAALRRAWQRYIDSLPATPQDEHVSDTEAMNELRPPPVDRKVVSSFIALARVVLAHLPAEDQATQTKKLRGRLKPGTSPTEALGAWILANTGPKSNVGVIAIDWKAREEVLWQARRLCASHSVQSDWEYDHVMDEEWKGWQERGEFSVDSPLRAFALALQRTRIVLIRFAVDDMAFAFAVGRGREDEVLSLCDALGIKVVADR